MTPSRRLRANRRRWAEPVAIVRSTTPLPPEVAEAIQRRFREAVARRSGPILVGPGFEVYR